MIFLFAAIVVSFGPIIAVFRFCDVLTYFEMDSGKIGSEAHRKIKKMQERSSENCQQVSRKVFRRRIRTLEKDGFTLLEVIIALAILGIGLLAILQVFPGAVRSSVRTEYNSRAPLIAQQIMETFKADDEDLRFIRGLPAYIPVPAPPEPIDDDGDGRYSEEFRNGSDDDGDGEFDEDLCEYTVFPPLPFALPPPNQEMYWQLLTTVATDKNEKIVI